MASWNRVLAALAASCLVVATLGCGEEPETNGNQSNNGNQTNGNQTDNQNSNLEDWNPQFVEIAEIVQGTCALPTCHGADPSGNTDMLFGGNQTDVSFEAIRDVFENYQADSGRALVAPGDSGESELYLAVTSDNPDILMPPYPVEPLSQAQVELIRSWIDDGANYE